MPGTDISASLRAGEMTEQQVAHEQSKLRQCLQLLSRDQGICRPNLLEFLNGHLADLKLLWSINPDRGAEAARQTIRASIYALVAQLVPRQSKQPLALEQRAVQYQRVVLAYFNALRDDLGLQDMSLTQRREWLADPKRGPLKVAVRTSQRDFDDAISQIAEMLTHGDYKPIRSEDGDLPTNNLTSSQLGATEPESAPAADAPSEPDASPADLPPTSPDVTVDELRAYSAPIRQAEVPVFVPTVDDLAVSLAMRRGMHKVKFILEYTAHVGVSAGRTPKQISHRARSALADLKRMADARMGTAKMRNAARRARWSSPTAYSDFDIDTEDGARNMYRQLTQEATEAVCSGEMSVNEVVSILRSNVLRPDISGHDPNLMTEQIALSVDRMRRVLIGEDNTLQGRVIDEEGNVIPGLQQATGASVRRNRDGQIVGHGANLISNSEIDAWMRGVLEHTHPSQLAAANLTSIRILTNHMRERLDRSVEAQKALEQKAAEAAKEFGKDSPEAVAAQGALVWAELETKRQIAAVDVLGDAMRSASPAKMRYFVENVSGETIDMGAAGLMYIGRLIELLRGDEDFRRYRGLLGGD
ncbi:hypothetical protein RB614_00920 [Phytohabitans sp. ZYX-F-186]|uniref:Uncharacterized protein n=1 Tax=Phytohabitans maris TaxID=3071409 RepID=A0ABU0ZAV6_9ACTN|nr:hypothetical protein [Phytohabitans sp. ZYX-F-186]MDQ7903082.1 hypothetical protein [Phytohabitans sp. ZYX-F-186]